MNVLKSLPTNVCVPAGSERETLPCVTDIKSISISISVAAPPTNVRITQVSGSTPTLDITWNHPQIDAVVTNYTLHYTSGNDTGSVPAYSDTLVLLTDLIANGNDYEIIVEAESIHISGLSEPVIYQPCKLLL